MCHNTSIQNSANQWTPYYHMPQWRKRCGTLHVMGTKLWVLLLEQVNNAAELALLLQTGEVGASLHLWPNCMERVVESLRG